MGRTTHTRRSTRSTAIIRATATGRPVAAGGWRRALVGVLVGAVAGALALAVRRPGNS